MLQQILIARLCCHYQSVPFRIENNRPWIGIFKLSKSLGTTALAREPVIVATTRLVYRISYYFVKQNGLICISYLPTKFTKLSQRLLNRVFHDACGLWMANHTMPADKRTDTAIITQKQYHLCLGVIVFPSSVITVIFTSGSFTSDIYILTDIYGL